MPDRKEQEYTIIRKITGRKFVEEGRKEEVYKMGGSFICRIPILMASPGWTMKYICLLIIMSFFYFRLFSLFVWGCVVRYGLTNEKLDMREQVLSFAGCTLHGLRCTTLFSRQITSLLLNGNCRPLTAHTLALRLLLTQVILQWLRHTCESVWCMNVVSYTAGRTGIKLKCADQLMRMINMNIPDNVSVVTAREGHMH